jgi:hypothetical protein
MWELVVDFQDSLAILENQILLNAKASDCAGLERKSAVKITGRFRFITQMILFAQVKPKIRNL